MAMSRRAFTRTIVGRKWKHLVVRIISIGLSFGRNVRLHFRHVRRAYPAIMSLDHWAAEFGCRSSRGKVSQLRGELRLLPLAPVATWIMRVYAPLVGTHRSRR